MVDGKVSYFDIKVNSPHKDLVVIKGNENECDPILLEGRVKLSINQNMHVKKIKLGLIGELSVSYFERDDHGVVTKHVIEKLTVLKVDWDNLLINDEGTILIGKYGEKPIKSTKIAKLHKLEEKFKQEILGEGNSNGGGRPNFDRAKSHSNLPSTVNNKKDIPTIKLPLSGIDGTPFKNDSSHHSFLLPKGNYSLPFKIVLPTTVCETVEGLSIGKILYKFESSIQKGMLFDKPLIKSKHFRIIRTLSPNSLNLIDNIEITNTWPQKLEYRVGLTKKGIAIGSTIPINILIVPLIKGLSIKKIICEIVQHYHVNFIDGKSPEFEQVFNKQTIYHKHQNGNEINNNSFEDYWDLSCHYKIPNNLKEITQSCALNNDLIQVKHRLRVIIQIKNPTGHISELRANLPVNLYISSNIGHVFGHHFEIDNHYGIFNIVKNKDDAFFKRDKISRSNTPLVSPAMSPMVTPLTSPGGSPTLHAIDDTLEDIEDELDNVMAPPLYELSKNDVIYDVTSTKSPIEQLGTSYFDLPTSRDSKGNNNNTSSAGGIYNHNISGISPGHSSIDLNLLSKVPTYSEAVEEDNDSNDLAPSYDNSFNNGNSFHYNHLESESGAGSLDSTLEEPQSPRIHHRKNMSSGSLPYHLENDSISSLTQSLQQALRPSPTQSRSSSHLKLNMKWKK